MTKEFALKIHLNSVLFLNICQKFVHYFGTSVFYSGGSYDSSNRSFLCLFPYKSLWISDNVILNPWISLRQELSFSPCESDFPDWIGFFSYELGAFSDEDAIIDRHASEFPLAYFQKCAVILSFDHKTGAAKVRVVEEGIHLLDDTAQKWVQCLSIPSKWENLIRQEEEDLFNPPLSLTKPLESLHEYTKKIEIAHAHIRSGDIYQVNLSHQLSLTGKRDPFQVFRKLMQTNPSPFAAFLHLKNYTIVSSSPERFLKKKGPWLETRPIKGTISRGRTEEEDRINLEFLCNSPKDQAELLMITDLMRHDLGKVSLAGSVTVNDICRCEAYQNVYHLLSIIKSKAIPSLHPLDVLRACFPGGSITGCPKLSAMALIKQLETRPRNIYTGSIGYFTTNGDFDFNIAIRTLLMTENHIDIQLGGAIVADSHPESEYNETLQKGASIFKVLQLNNFEY